MNYELLLKGGHVIDPAAGVNGLCDVAFASGRVAAVASSIPGAACRTVVDVSGRYVVPGLVDVHAHAFLAGHNLGIETDEACRSSGVTTLVDAGSTGAATLATAPLVAFHFGDYHGHVSRELYDKFQTRYSDLRKHGATTNASGAAMMDDVMRVWLGL